MECIAVQAYGPGVWTAGLFELLQVNTNGQDYQG